MTSDQGEGSAATVSRIMSGAYDAGFGDMNAIIQNAATNPDDAPVMVYQIYNQPPFEVLTKQEARSKTRSEGSGGRELPPGSASTKPFPASATAASLTQARLNCSLCRKPAGADANPGPSLYSLVFNVTSYLNIIGTVDPKKISHGTTMDCLWPEYILQRSDGLTYKLLKNKPEAVKGLVNAIAKAMADVLNPQEGIDIYSATRAIVQRQTGDETFAITVKQSDLLRRARRTE